MAGKTQRTVGDSRVTLTQLMLPTHANAFGNVHGGAIMKMVDETAAIAAMRFSQRPCVTLAIDSLTFRQPVHVGELVSCEAFVTYAGRTSLEVAVKVHAENPISGEVTHTNSAFLVFVALDDLGRPYPVPELALTNDEEKRRFQEGYERQQHRLRVRRNSDG